MVDPFNQNGMRQLMRLIMIPSISKSPIEQEVKTKAYSKKLVKFHQSQR